MKKLFFLMVGAFLLFYSCEQQPIQPEQPPVNNDAEIENFNNSLRGVWLVDENNDKGLFFLSLQPISNSEGKYALCVSKYIMSSGTYKISSSNIHRLQLTNYMGHNCGDLYAGVDGNNTISVTGYITSYDRQHNDNFHYSFNKTNEKFSYPVVGQTYSYDGLHATYGSFNQYVTLTSNYMITSYCEQVHGSHTIFGNRNYYYVYRNRHVSDESPLVYTQRCDGYDEGEIHIYQLDAWTLGTFESTEIVP